MDKVQKFEYTQQIENYLEENQVYELFENMLQQILLHKPERPLDFMIEKLNVEPSKFFIFPLTCNSQTNVPNGSPRKFPSRKRRLHRRLVRLEMHHYGRAPPQGSVQEERDW
jgi:hypothetical protein